MANKLTNCPVCGAEMATNAKSCPQCGAKNKNPIYKKWWFWVIILFVVCGIIGSTSSDAGKNQSNSSSTAESISANESIPVNNQAEDATAANMSIGQKNALKAAKNYLSFSAFSYEGLIQQLEFEKYSHDDAVFAVDNCGADWNEQALKSAKNYLDTSAFSHDSLVQQLEFEKYTTEQAIYGADNCGADWNEQAAKSAKDYLNFSSFSRDSLIQQLEFEKFTHEQAVYGAEQNGY